MVFLLLGFVLQAGFVLGAETDRTKLEVEYPKVPDTEEPNTFQNFAKYVFNFILVSAGLLCLGVFIYGGIIYLVSAGNPKMIAISKKIILEGFLGLIILISSYLILFKINPALTVFNLEKKEVPKIEPAGGFYLCKQSCDKTDADCIAKHCSGVSAGTMNVKEKNYKEHLFIQPKDSTLSHLVLLFDDNKEPRKGGAFVYLYRKDRDPAEGNFNGNEIIEKAKVINIYTFNEPITGSNEKEEGVRFYEHKGDFENQDHTTGLICPDKKTFYKARIYGYPDMEQDFKSKCGEKNPELRVIQIRKPHFVILFQKKDFKGNCKLFESTDSNLGGNFEYGKGFLNLKTSYARVGSMLLFSSNY